MNTDLITYYRKRAKEYEKIYDKPERQADLVEATTFLQDCFAGKSVLEIACGTGYWTERIAATATSVLATDVNATVIDVAKNKTFPRHNVAFEVADLYQFQPAEKYDAVFGGFIWSHILLEDLDEFIRTVNNLVKPGGQVVFMDNRYVSGSSTPITSTDVNGNTFQTRKLENGDTWQVLKNFPSVDFLKNTLRSQSIRVAVKTLEYYWIAVGGK
ncbi:MAG: class I SAM-dependent methyltransferase [Bacteroidia bacterium]